MGRGDLERLSREELIELVMRLQRPEKTSRTSSKPSATDRKERREQSKPGVAKPGHEGHSRVMSEDPNRIVEHRPDHCACCGGALRGNLPAEILSASKRIELPEVAPVVIQHRRLAVLPVPRDAVRSASAGGGAGHAVRPAAARGGDVSKDLRYENNVILWCGSQMVRQMPKLFGHVLVHKQHVHGETFCFW